MSTDKNPSGEEAGAGNFISKEEIDQLVKTLSAMKVKPKAETPTQLLGWMSEFVEVARETGAIPKTPVKTEFFSPFSKQTVDFTSPFKQPARIAIFSGGKSDSSYELWRYEVMFLSKEGYSKETIMNAIRRSLKGEPANVMMRLGPGNSIDEILQKFDSIYGNVLGTEDILAEFYSARQKVGEDCAAWSVRLEDLLNQAVSKGKVSPSNANDMLRTMFYKGLRPDLKDISGHIFQTTLDFDTLRIAIRKLETDHQPDLSVKAKLPLAKAAQDVTDERFNQIQAQLNQITSQIQQMNQPQPQSYYQPPYQPRQRFQKGKKNYQGKRGRNKYRGKQSSHEVSADLPAHPMDNNEGKIICYKCHQEGHVAIGCRVRLDHQRAPLNSSRPNPGAKDQASLSQGPSTKKH